MRWRLAAEFGWTLEYIDSLSVGDIIQYISIADGKAHAAKSIIK